MLSNDTEQTTEDILSVRTGYLSKSLRIIEKKNFSSDFVL